VQVGDLVKCTLEEIPTFGVVTRPGKWTCGVLIGKWERWISLEYLEKLNDAND